MADKRVNMKGHAKEVENFPRIPWISAQYLAKPTIEDEWKCHEWRK
jgi:hypothetical protein